MSAHPLHRLVASAGLAALLGAAAPAARAQPAVATAGAAPVAISQEQLLALVGRLDALEKHNEELEGQILDLKAQAAGNNQAIREQVNNAPTVSLANGRPTFASADGQFTASIRGIVQLDAAHYDQHSPGPLATDFRRGSVGDATEADRARDLGDGTNFRRARFGVEGKAWGDWNYNLLFDFGGSGVEDVGKITNAYVEYAGFTPVKLRVGAFAPTTGLEDATANTASLFPERPAVAELVRGLAGGDGRTGAAVLANGDRWSMFGAITGNTIAVQTFDEQLGFVGRLTYVPYKDADNLVHIGASANIVINPAATGPDVAPAGAATPIRLRERPELRVDGTRLVDTGNIDADDVRAYGLEGGLQHRQFSLAGEYFWLDVNRRASVLADPSFDGWYLQGAWTLTGQPRRYNVAAGGFDAPKIDKPFSLREKNWGVWELAARYSELNLDYRAGLAGTAQATSSIRGGDQKIFTLGLNWYANSNVRFLADYQRVDVNRLSAGGTAFGAGALTPPAGAQIGQTLNIWSFRTQYAF
ncbi:porin [Phenylobacterium sp.]|uniref:OprO/OprP family phosphate-selective porin n=1 Tax=Phenylobacterium sp. TaxID=1871053 RepID=UPI0025E1B07B|nr:porin [Phenylobacterium sp.]